MSEQEKEVWKMLFDNITIDVMKLTKKIGFKNYKKVQKLMDEVYE